MKNISSLLIKVAARLIISAGFSAIWVFTNDNVSPNAPLVFCGAICLTAAWFSYLKKDGIKFTPPFSLREMRARRMEKNAEFLLRRLDNGKERQKPETKPVKDTSAAIKANALAGVILIASSFLFSGIII